MKKSVESILNEKILLGQLNNPFLVNMRCAFQDTENLYLVLDYLSGGDLRYHLFTRVDFSENECSNAFLTQSLWWAALYWLSNIFGTTTSSTGT